MRQLLVASFVAAKIAATVVFPYVFQVLCGSHEFSSCSLSMATSSCLLSLVPNTTGGMAPNIVGVSHPPPAGSVIQAVPQHKLLLHVPRVCFSSSLLSLVMDCRLPMDSLLGLLPCQIDHFDTHLCFYCCCHCHTLSAPSCTRAAVVSPLQVMHHSCSLPNCTP